MTTPAETRLYLGIDTGGTFTDAVLLDADMHLVAKAKSLTTYDDLSRGIMGALDQVLALSGARSADIGLASLSTTLATNALVEGVGATTGLVMIGFSPADAERAGLREALGQDPVVYCDGGHDGQGRPKPLDLAPLEAWLDGAGGPVDGYAIAACFAVRNPAHEQAAKDLIVARTQKTATCSHELSAKLGGPKRALTTVLNARLVPMIAALLDSMGAALISRGIIAPLMIVRGDGALISEAFARSRPIETILSGPAASLFGASYLTGLANGIVSDIGGTTTDIAILDQGQPRIDNDGAFVGGHRTMVEAVAMRTFGLGGDSEVTMAETGLEAKLFLGPKRVIPLCQAAISYPDHIIPQLTAQTESPYLPRYGGRFVRRNTVPDAVVKSLSARAQKILERISSEPHPIEKIITANAERATLDQLIARRIVSAIGFTPTDAAHVTGLQQGWSQEAALLGANLFARRKTGAGKDIAANGMVLSQNVLALLKRRSAEVMLETAFSEDGYDGAKSVQHPTLQQALDGKMGIARLSLALDRPVIGLGASAGLHYAGLDQHMTCEIIVPEDADVANAIGAVVGHVSIKTLAHLSALGPDRFHLSVGTYTETITGETKALAKACALAKEIAEAEAARAGAIEITSTMTEDIRATENDGQRIFVEAIITVTARGRPRVAK